MKVLFGLHSLWTERVGGASAAVLPASDLPLILMLFPLLLTSQNDIDVVVGARSHDFLLIPRLGSPLNFAASSLLLLLLSR